jgi:hypothetical protein
MTRYAFAVVFVVSALMADSGASEYMGWYHECTPTCLSNTRVALQCQYTWFGGDPPWCYDSEGSADEHWGNFCWAVAHPYEYTSWYVHWWCFDEPPTGEFYCSFDVDDCQ